MHVEVGHFLSCMMFPCLACSLRECKVMNAKLEFSL
jgi:hypothetical protein